MKKIAIALLSIITTLWIFSNNENYTLWAVSSSITRGDSVTVDSGKVMVIKNYAKLDIAETSQIRFLIDDTEYWRFGQLDSDSSLSLQFYNSGWQDAFTVAEDGTFIASSDIVTSNTDPLIYLIDTNAPANEKMWTISAFTSGGGGYGTFGVHGRNDLGAITDTAFYFTERVLRTPGEIIADDGVVAGEYLAVVGASPFLMWYEDPPIHDNNARYDLGMNGGKLYLADMNSAGTISDTVLTVVPSTGSGHSYTAIRSGNVMIGSTGSPSDKLEVSGGDIRVSDTHPSILLNDTSEGTGERIWGINSNAGNMYIATHLDDDEKTGRDTLVRFDRTRKSMEMYGARPSMRFYDTGGTSNEHMYEWAGAGEKLSLLMLADSYAPQDTIITVYRSAESTYGVPSFPRIAVGSHRSDYDAVGEIEIQDNSPVIFMDSPIAGAACVLTMGTGSTAAFVMREASTPSFVGTSTGQLVMAGRAGTAIVTNDSLRSLVKPNGDLFTVAPTGRAMVRNYGYATTATPSCLYWPVNLAEIAGAELESHKLTSSSLVQRWGNSDSYANGSLLHGEQYFLGTDSVLVGGIHWLVDGTEEDGATAQVLTTKGGAQYAFYFHANGAFSTGDMDSTYDFSVYDAAGAYSKLNAGSATFTTSSDRAKKKNILPLFDSVVLALREAYEEFDIARWDWKTEEDGEGNHVGPIAQDFAPVSTILHGVEGDTTMFQSSDMTMANTILIQDLLKRVEELERKLENCEQLAP